MDGPPEAGDLSWSVRTVLRFATRDDVAARVPTWQLSSFLTGLFAIFLAVSSSLDTYSETLLFMQMAQHFILMSVDPQLILLGSPFVPMLRGLSRSIVRLISGTTLRSSVAHFLSELFSRLSFAWLAMNLTYVDWHIPKATKSHCPRKAGTTLNISTSLRRALSLVACRADLGLHNADRTPGLSFCILVFSGRLLYPSYGVVERPFGIDALKTKSQRGPSCEFSGLCCFLFQPST